MTAGGMIPRRFSTLGATSVIAGDSASSGLLENSTPGTRSGSTEQWSALQRRSLSSMISGGIPPSDVCQETR